MQRYKILSNKEKVHLFFSKNITLSICKLGFYCVFSRYGLLFHATAQREWQASDVPIPYLRNSARYVSDPDGLLKPAERDSADYYLGRLERSKGVQSLFVIVNRVKDGDAFRMAQDLGNRLGVGDKETRRGLVVVIAVKDKRYFIAPGMGLESELTDVDCDDIAQACVVPYMREGQPGKAIWATARALYNKVSTGKTGVKSIDEDGDAGDLVFAAHPRHTGEVGRGEALAQSFPFSFPPRR